MNSVAKMRAWLKAAPDGTTLSAVAVLALLPEEGPFDAGSPAPPTGPVTGPATAYDATWRERIWTCPPDTRLGVTEAAEAFGRPRSWVYRHTSPKSGLVQLPYKKLDGELQFVASEIRAWIKHHEKTVVESIGDITPIRRRRTGNGV